MEKRIELLKVDVASKEESTYLVTDLSSKLEKATSERVRWEGEMKELRMKVEESRRKEGEMGRKIEEIETQLAAATRSVADLAFVLLSAP